MTNNKEKITQQLLQLRFLQQSCQSITNCTFKTKSYTVHSQLASVSNLHWSAAHLKDLLLDVKMTSCSFVNIQNGRWQFAINIGLTNCVQLKTLWDQTVSGSEGDDKAEYWIGFPILFRISYKKTLKMQGFWTSHDLDLDLGSGHTVYCIATLVDTENFHSNWKNYFVDGWMYISRLRYEFM